MKERMNPRWFLILSPILLWSAIILLIAGAAHAQTGWFVFSERESGQPHGLYLRGWNTTGIEIAAGTVVMADSVASVTVPQIALGKGFKTWSGDTGDFGKLMGVLIDNCPGNSSARIMVKGFLPNVKVMGGISAGSYLRPSFTAVGRLAAWTANDSTNQYRRKQVGQMQRYARTDSAIAWSWIDFPAR